MNGSKPTSPAYCCWRLGGRFKKGIAAEYLERGGAVVLVLPVEGDETMANGDVDVSVMTYSLLCVILVMQFFFSVLLLLHVLCSSKAFQSNALALVACGFVRFKG